jgi:hypothetical protein
LKELKRFDGLRDCLVASEITNATPALTKRVAEHLDDPTWRMSVVIEPGHLPRCSVGAGTSLR